MPSESSWNTPRVSPRDRRSYVARSSSGIFVWSMRCLPFASMLFNVSRITVKLDRPRKSILTSPSVSQVWYSSVVVTVPSVRSSNGDVLLIGSLPMMVAQACTPVWRIRPSMPIASSVTRFASGSELYSSRNSRASAYRFDVGSKMSCRGMSLPPVCAGGSALVMRSPTENSYPMIRAESFNACLVLMVP